MSTISSSMSSTGAYSAMMPPPPQKPSAEDFASFLVSSLDQNSDSALSIDELELSEEDFTSLDTDGDGSLTTEELTQTIASKLEELEASKPSQEEFAAMMQEMGIQPPPPSASA